MADSNRKEIYLKLDGEGITPDALGIKLLDFMRQSYLLVESCTDQPVGFSSIESNCILSKMLVPASLALAVVCGDSIADSVNYNSYHDAARKLNRIVSQYNAQLTIVDASIGRERIFDGVNILLPETEVQIITRATMPIYGELREIGGDGRINAHIKSSYQNKAIVLDATMEIAQKLGSRLYTQIGVIAEVNMSGDYINNGKIIEVLDFKPKSLKEWLDHIDPAVGAAWNDIDTDQFIRDIRGWNEG